MAQLVLAGATPEDTAALAEFMALSGEGQKKFVWRTLVPLMQEDPQVLCYMRKTSPGSSLGVANEICDILETSPGSDILLVDLSSDSGTKFIELVASLGPLPTRYISRKDRSLIAWQQGQVRSSFHTTTFYREERGLSCTHVFVMVPPWSAEAPAPWIHHAPAVWTHHAPLPSTAPAA